MRNEKAPWLGASRTTHVALIQGSSHTALIRTQLGLKHDLYMLAIA